MRKKLHYNSRVREHRVMLVRLPQISQFSNIETLEDPQIKSQVKAAEDGRNKSIYFPPLAASKDSPRELGLGRRAITSDTWNNYQGPATEIHESHWQIPPKRVRDVTDKKIVVHLRKKLTKRIERRLENILDENGTDYDEEETPRDHGDVNIRLKTVREKDDIFHKYTEYGEKRPKCQTPEYEDHSKGQATQLPQLTNHVHILESKPDEDNENTFGADETFPVEDPKENGEVHTNNEPLYESHDEIDSGHEGDDDVESENESVLNGNNVESEKEEEEPRREISPVPTPVISRPETVFAGRMTNEEKAQALLKGQINVNLEDQQRIIHLYIHSAGSDTEAERSALIEKVFPNLKTFCLEKGYEFRPFDLSWGSREFLADDHRDMEIRKKIISMCRQNAIGVNVVTFMAQKYGDAILPAMIPRIEYEAILQAMKKDYDQIKAMEELQKQLAEEEAAKRQAELEGLESETASIQESVYPATQHPGGSASAASRQTSGSVTSAKLMRRAPRKISTMGASQTPEVDPDPSLLESWYFLDMNTVPPVYKLHRISTHHKDISSKDASRRSGAMSSWIFTAKKLQRLLYAYARRIMQLPDDLLKYNMSLADLELMHSLNTYSEHAPSKSIFWFKREIENLVITGDRIERDYMDLRENADLPDSEKAKRLKELRDYQLETQLGEINNRRYIVPWSKHGISPTHTRSHQTYIDRMCKEFTDVIGRRITDAIASEPKQLDQNPLIKEVLQHVNAVRSKASGFHGRKDILSAIKRYVRGVSRVPLVIHGKPGCGKTSVIARAVKDTQKWLKIDGGCRTIVRMIGVTGESTNIRTLLMGLCSQLAIIYNMKATKIPMDYKGLFNYLSYQMLQAENDDTLVIYFDSLHKLKEENDGKKMSWLPKDLPPNVRIILSTKTQDDSYKNMSKIYAEDHPDHFVEVKELGTSDAMTILTHWYNNSDRKVTDEQFQLIIDNFKSCPYPLYIKALFNESLMWPSTKLASELKIPNSVKNLATVFFGRLERDHGDTLVRRALGYITAARSGISDNEMEDLLSLDDTVMDDVVAHNSHLSLRRLPSLLWVRLREELGGYVKYIQADNLSLLTWTFGLFREAGVERYMDQRDKAPSYHKAMSEYFMNIWYQKPKPHGSNHKGHDRYIMSQPMFIEIPGSRGKPSRRVYNLRKLNELPFQLLKSEQKAMLKSSCLLNFDFLQAKLSGCSLRNLLDDIHMALNHEPADLDLKLLSDTLHLSGSALINDSQQLASQLVGRLHDTVLKDKPIAPGDPVKYPFMKPLFFQAKKCTTPSLIPSGTCLTAPGGILFDLLSGHTEPITALTLTLDGQRAFTTSKDNTMKQWELKTGRVMKTIVDVGETVNQIRLAQQNKVAVTSELNCVRIWDIKSGECLKDISTFDPASLTVAQEGRLLVAFFHGSNVMKTWDLKEGGIPLKKEITLEEPENFVVHKDQSIICAQTAVGPLVLHAYKSHCVASVTNAKNGKEVHKLKCKEDGAIHALCCARDYFICAARYQYMKLHEIFQLELFDVRNGQYVRSVRGCVADNISEIFVNQVGSHAMAVNISESSNTTDIALWNIETEDHKHLAKHAKVSNIGACANLKSFLTAAVDEPMLRIWNLSGNVNQPQPKPKPKEGIESLVPLRGNKHYVVAKYINNGPLAIWNVVKGKLAGKAIRVERGLLDPLDTMIVHNTKLIILADKGFSSANPGGPPIYSTIRIFDLFQKKYTHRVKDCFIVPCPAHEYTMLDDEHLMGLADNRTHFVVWNINNGQIAFRIKSNFKEMERKGVDRGMSELRKHSPMKPSRGTTAKMTPWERRSETQSAKMKRHQREWEEEQQEQEALRKEKDNGIDRYIISKDMSTIVASFYAHHICIFDIPSRTHVQTLENPNSMLLLLVAALTSDGDSLVHANYDEETKTSYLTLWDCKSGTVRRRLRNERNVAAIAISDDGNRIVFGKTNKEMRIWEPLRHNVLRKIKGYTKLEFGINSQIHILEEGTKAVVYAGDISLWDLEKGEVLSVFTPDMKIQCLTLAMDGKMVVFGLRDSFDIITLRLMGREIPQIDIHGKFAFGESDTSTDDEDDEEEEKDEEDE